LFKRSVRFHVTYDFGLRFELRYDVTCDVEQFGGAPGVLKAFLRVRHEGGTEMLFGDQLSFSGAPKELSHGDLKKMHSLLQFGGALGAGAGVYELQLLVVDHRNRSYRHRWTAKAFPHGRESSVSLSMQPNTLAPLSAAPLPPKPGERGPSSQF
jgi:hypothetical protein